MNGNKLTIIYEPKGAARDYAELALNHMDPPEPIDLVEAHRAIMEILEFRHCNYEFKKSFTDL